MFFKIKTYYKKNMSAYESHPEHPIIKPLWRGNPIMKNGKFVNLDTEFKTKTQNIATIIKKTHHRGKTRKLTKHYSLKVQHIKANIFDEKNTIIWFWHASFFLNLDGIKILIDPVYFDISGIIKRKAWFPIDVNEIKNIDYVLISHDHRDHLDKKTLKKIIKNNPDCKFITGLKNEILLESITKKEYITSLGWYQKIEINEKLKINFLPAHHRGRRGFKDTAKRLWGSFLFELDEKKIYFAWDSWYGKHFKEISELFGEIDIAMIGIGAYNSILSNSPHTCPNEALKAASDLNAKMFIPMHYGTYDISAEPINEPLEKLQSFEIPQNIELKIVNIWEVVGI